MTARRDTPAPGVLKIHVPFAIRKHGGRKVIVSPEGHLSPSSGSRASPPLLKALARAFRWRSLLECGDYATIDEIARAEGVNSSYVSRVLRLALLAPNMVEGILDGRWAPELQDLLKPFPVAWDEQTTVLVSPLDAPTTCRDANVTRVPRPERCRHTGFAGSFQRREQWRGEAARLDAGEGDFILG